MNKSTIFYTHKQIIEDLDISSRQLIYFVDKGVVKPETNAHGRGSSRRYTADNISEVKLGILLRNTGVNIDTIGEIVASFRALQKEDKMEKYKYMLLADNGDCWFSDTIPSTIDDAAVIVVNLNMCRPGLEYRGTNSDKD